MKTRAKKAAPTIKSTNAETTTTKPQSLEPSVSNPAKVFILPKDASSESRIVTLPNPATSTPCRYLVCPEKGFYEFTKIAASKRACRSWLLAPDRTDKALVEAEKEGNEGYVLQTPELMVATPIDPLFIVLPALVQSGQEGGKQMYLALSEYLDRLEEKSEHFREVMRNDGSGRLVQMFEARLRGVCDSMEAGDEVLYRLSHTKLLGELVGKAKRMVERGLPASMEEHFVKQSLVVPVMSVKREESSISLPDAEETTPGAEEGDTISTTTSQDTQTSSITVASVSTTATSIAPTASADPSAAPKEITHLLRLRTALNFILTSYIPPTLRHELTTATATATSSSPLDFSPLDKHLEHLASLKREAQALRSLSENISRKRGLEDEDEALERLQVKKKKKEEEEFKKKNMSRGVQQLKKVDTSGMSKLSSFFGKGAVKK